MASTMTNTTTPKIATTTINETWFTLLILLTQLALKSLCRGWMDGTDGSYTVTTVTSIAVVANDGLWKLNHLHYLHCLNDLHCLHLQYV